MNSRPHPGYRAAGQWCCPGRAAPALTLVAAGAVVAMLLVFQHTMLGMVALWSRSATFAHGFAVLPVAAWLAWRQRHALLLVLAAPAPAPAPLRQRLAGPLLMLPLGLAWLLASLVPAPVVMDYALVLMLAATVLATLGWPATRVLAFPLSYMLLAVPFGEVFIPPLINFTANFTVAALQLSGIPVYRDQQLLSIPSGNWSVEAACSGLRYLIASVALGTLYAHLSFRSGWRRLLFVAIALLLPLLANGLRAYGIVLLGHWSDMRLAVGVDHLVYGWLFFGLVCLLLFWCGSFWRETALPPTPPGPPSAAPSSTMPLSALRHGLAGAVACVGLALGWSLLSTALAPADGVHAGQRLARFVAVSRPIALESRHAAER